jgi:hypothetical protein
MLLVCQLSYAPPHTDPVIPVLTVQDERDRIAGIILEEEYEEYYLVVDHILKDLNIAKERYKNNPTWVDDKTRVKMLSFAMEWYNRKHADL